MASANNGCGIPGCRHCERPDDSDGQVDSENSVSSEEDSDDSDYGSRTISPENPEDMFDVLDCFSKVGDRVYACPGPFLPVYCVILSIQPLKTIRIGKEAIMKSAEVVLCACDEESMDRVRAGEFLEDTGAYRFSQRLAVGEIFRINLDLEMNNLRDFKERKTPPKELLALPSASRMDALAVYESLLDTEVAAMAQFTTQGLKTRSRFYKK